MTSRRKFMKNVGLAATAITILPRHVLGKGYVAPSDKLYIAGIGVGGKGQSDLSSFAKNPNATISVLCDVDDRRAATSVKSFPKASITKIIERCSMLNTKTTMQYPYLLPIICMPCRPWQL
jgi:hypothetical protein